MTKPAKALCCPRSLHPAPRLAATRLDQKGAAFPVVWLPLATALFLAGCSERPPTVEELRTAYATHMRGDPVHEKGLSAKEAPVVIPQQEPRCKSDGSGHFDCRIRVIYETDGDRHSKEQAIHVRREGGGWIIDSID